MMVPSDRALVVEPNGRMLVHDRDTDEWSELSTDTDVKRMVEEVGPTRIVVVVGAEDRPLFGGLDLSADPEADARETRVTLAWRRWRRLQDELNRNTGQLASVQFSELKDITERAFWRWMALEEAELP
jgi:hypothetical protein